MYGVSWLRLLVARLDRSCCRKDCLRIGVLGVSAGDLDLVALIHQRHDDLVRHGVDGDTCCTRPQLLELERPCAFLLVAPVTLPGTVSIGVEAHHATELDAKHVGLVVLDPEPLDASLYQVLGVLSIEDDDQHTSKQAGCIRFLAEHSDGDVRIGFFGCHSSP